MEKVLAFTTPDNRRAMENLISANVHLDTAMTLAEDAAELFYGRTKTQKPAKPTLTMLFSPLSLSLRNWWGPSLTLSSAVSLIKAGRVQSGKPRRRTNNLTASDAQTKSTLKTKSTCEASKAGQSPGLFFCPGFSYICLVSRSQETHTKALAAIGF